MTTINTNSPNRSYTITGVNNDVTYKVRVAAVNSIGAGPFTEYVFATPSLFSVDNDFYNVELLLNMDQTSNSDNFYGNSSLILGTPGLDQNDDQYSVQTKLLLHGDGIAIVDSSLNPKSISRVNSPYTVSDNMFGTGSIRFTGSNYLSMGSSNDFSVGTGDFTVELFIKFKSINTYNPICNSTNDVNSADSSKWYINYAPGTGLYVGQHSSSNSAVTAWSASIDTWYHLAITRTSGTIKIFIDGTEQTVSNSTVLNNISFNQSGFLVGRVTSLSGLDAQIDEFRFTKGIARNITVPTVSYPNPTNPFKDLSSNSKNIIVIGQPLVSSYSDAPSTAPTNIVASQQSGGPLRLDWDFTFPLLVDYVVQYSDDGGINWTTVNDGVSTNNNVIINLVDGFYIFRIAATNSLGQGPWSETKDVTLPMPASVEYLVVAGGGGGGNDMGGGGGAGGLITNVSGAVSGGGSTAESALYLEGNTNTLNIVVGAGGSGASSGSGGAGTNGGNSTIVVEGNDLVTAIGGGYGASQHNGNSWNASNGGSGGGGSGGRQNGGSYGGLPGNGTTKQGFSGAGSGPHWYPGGGGGAGGSGIGDGSVRGHGGPGVLSSILGTLYYWAGGGGASGHTTTGGDGGIGGGGGGAIGTTSGGTGVNNGSAGGGGGTNSQANTPGGNAGTNTGSGGGGGSHYNSNNYGGSGGSGAVILRSLTSATSTTGSPTVSTNGLYNIYMFTGTGSITFSSTPTTPPPPKNIMNIQNAQGDLILSWDTVASSYNVTDYVVEYRSTSGSSWTTVSDGVSSSTGATISGLALGDYVVRVAAVNSVGQGPWRAKFITISPIIDAEYLIIAGGAGGGFNEGGGGGAGGYRYFDSQTFFVGGTTYPVTVGAGGSGSNNGSPGFSGSLSSFDGKESAGGGGGNSNCCGNPGISGGSGGGASPSGTGGAGNTPATVPAQGNNGGRGGGGAGSAGSDQSSNAGNGGAGTSSSITGISVVRAGGGGAGWQGGPGDGGSGGGANGAASGGIAANGTVNTGGGGGGGGSYGGSGGSGGSGVVIIRTPGTAASTTGSPTVTQDGSYNIYTFTGTGSITF